ncbi:MAG: glycosyltransferase family 2 protein [Verrucomicrobia bacterium]|nr:glycosyltransferase family 2 protein [Verrucomicrobiota bacterium]
MRQLRTDFPFEDAIFNRSAEEPTPKISVVIPVYNKAAAIQTTLESVTSQKLSVPFEIVVVDDGSRDQSGEIIRDLAQTDARIRYFFQENTGVSAARNYGVKQARGEWVVFLDADDLFLPGGLQELYQATTPPAYTTDIDFACANFLTHGGKPFLPKMKAQIITNGFRAWVLRLFFPRTGTFIFRRAQALKFPFDTKLKRYEDAKFLFDYFRTRKPIATSPVPVMIYREEFCTESKARDFEQDFLCELNFFGKSFWEKLALGGLLATGIRTYGPSVREHYIDFLIWAKFHEILRVLVRMQNSVLKRIAYLSRLLDHL